MGGYKDSRFFHDRPVVPEPFDHPFARTFSYLRRSDVDLITANQSCPICLEMFKAGVKPIQSPPATATVLSYDNGYLGLLEEFNGFFDIRIFRCRACFVHYLLAYRKGECRRGYLFSQTPYDFRAEIKPFLESESLYF